MKKTPLFENQTKRSLKPLVGEQIYASWLEMLKQLVPQGRTHRLAVVIAGMLQYARQVASKKSRNKYEDGSVESSLLTVGESDDYQEMTSELDDIITQLFDDAQVLYTRTNYRGDEYSIIDSAVMEFIHWFDMPWE